jgi:hypothetical protein
MCHSSFSHAFTPNDGKRYASRSRFLITSFAVEKGNTSTAGFSKL